MEAPAVLPKRETRFDVIKGIGITEVIVHHCLGFSARKFSMPYTIEWWVIQLSNRFLHFAIPTFLLVSAVLLARSLGKGDRMKLGRYSRRRVERSLVPYVVWSLLFLAARALFLKNGSDVQPYTGQFLGLAWSGPRAIADPSVVWHNLVWGKAFFHLYFLSVLLQLSIVLPAVILFFKRIKWSFGMVVLASVVLQAILFRLQQTTIRASYPGSLITWYTPSLVIGVWLGLNWKQWDAIWAKNRIWIMLATLVGAGPYLGISVWLLRVPDLYSPPASYIYNVSFCLFATGMALTLLGLCAHVDTERPFGKLMSHLGFLSLPLFVLHVVVLHFLNGPTISGILDAIPGSPIATIMLVSAVTWVLVQFLILCRLDLILFGRRYASGAERNLGNSG